MTLFNQKCLITISLAFSGLYTRFLFWCALGNGRKWKSYSSLILIPNYWRFLALSWLVFECDVFLPMSSSLRCTQLDKFILFCLQPVIISVELSKVAIKFQLDFVEYYTRRLVWRLANNPQPCLQPRAIGLAPPLTPKELNFPFPFPPPPRELILYTCILNTHCE